MGPFSGIYPRPGHHPARSLGPLCCRAVSLSTCQRSARGRPCAGAGAVVAPLVIVIVGGLMVMLGAAAHFYGAATSRDRQPDQQQGPMAGRPV